MRKFDFLVVGQGLAGTCLAIFLERAGKSVLLVDEEKAVTTSKVAAGFMHPVTGRRIVKTWMADQLFPFATTFYRSLEKESGRSFFRRMDSVEVVDDAKSLNDWMERSGDPSLKDYLVDTVTSGYEDKLHAHVRLFRVKHGGWLDIPAFLDYHRQRWKEAGLLEPITTDTNDVSDPERIRQTLRIDAERIVYCEGHSARNNPLWSWLPFDPVKGELLTVEIKELPQEHILVHGIFLIPLGDHRFRVGSTYSWHELDELPTEKGKRLLTEKLEQTIRLPFRILDQQAGVRPAVKGRRPLIGQHPERKDCWIFNGLGSKGSTLAPWFADHLTGHLLNGDTLLPDVDIRRFVAV